MVVKTPEDRMAERLTGFLFQLHEDGLIAWLAQSEEDAEEMGVAVREYAERERDEVRLRRFDALVALLYRLHKEGTIEYTESDGAEEAMVSLLDDFARNKWGEL